MTVPKFRNAHLRKVSKLVEAYGKENVEEGMEHCLTVRNCTAFELTAFLIIRYGGARAKKCLDKNFYYNCKARADGIGREKDGRNN